MDNNKRVASFTSDIRNLLAKYYLIPSVIVFVLLLFIILLLYGYSFYFTAQQEGKNASEDLETIVTSYLDGLSILINNQTLIDLLEDKGKQAESARILYDFVNSQDVGSDFFVLDVAGKARVGSSTILGSYLSSPPPYYSGFLYRLQQQPHNKTVMLSLLSEGRANSMVLSVGQAILKDGHIIGYLVFELSPTELLRTIFPGEVGELVVTNKFYTALISSNNLYVDKYSKLYSEYRVANSKYVKHQDKHYFITREYNQTLDMYLFVLVEISTIGRVILFSIAEKTGLPGLKQIASLKTSEHLNILIVAHGHLNRALAAAFTGMEASFSLTLTMENTGLSVLKGPEMKQNYRIHLWNQTVHLENF